MMTLTTQQNLLKAARLNTASWKKAVVFATYQPALFQNVESDLEPGKKSSYVDEISLDELDKYFPKAKRKTKTKAAKKASPQKASSKKETTRKTASKRAASQKIKRITRAPKKRVIRAKKTTSGKKNKKPATAMVVPTTPAITKREDKSSSFTSWLKHTKKEKIKTEKIQPEKKASLKQKIKRSTKHNNLLVTEPIAEQLVRQGFTSKAIKMYKQLKDFIPEKSAEFDAIIKDLKKTI